MASQAIKQGSRLRHASWAAVLSAALGLFLALTFHVNAIKSEVRLAERRIVQLEREKLRLETEFESRASQRQLAEWNAVDFGYVAPRAGQFLESEAQLASLGTPNHADAPRPIRVARAAPPPPPEDTLAEWVSPLSGQPMAGANTPEASDAVAEAARRAAAKGATTLAERLAERGTPDVTGLGEARQ
ncbi:hypothetical protein [Qipengyuania sediminis]|uniref:hypothetical protein n=1 Tax=Qipengyuania sediminis TaxID=1532023 RepID=UPI001F0DDDC0|nr:hypothetical protein [Qipengyuania sediminis]